MSSSLHNEEMVKYQGMANQVQRPGQAPVFTKVEDNGQKKTFATGAKRDRPVGKGRYDLIPAYSLLRLAIHYENGAAKYSERNWEKGLPLSEYVHSVMSHLVKFMGGDRSEDHFSAIVWNAFAYMHTEEMIRLGRLPQDLANFPEEGPFTKPPSNGTPP